MLVMPMFQSMQDAEMSANELKGALLDSFWGIDRGLSATAETRADINELITQLEAKSPCQNPTEVREQLLLLQNAACNGITGMAARRRT